MRWLGDPEVRRYLYVRHPVSLAEEERWFDDLLKRGETDRVFAIETKRGGRHIGNVGLHKIDHLNRRAEVGIFIGERACWGKGYGTDAIKLALAYAFDELHMHKVWLLHFDDNPRARRCYEKCGFEAEGVLRDHVFKRGAFHDEMVMSAINPAERGGRGPRRAGRGRNSGCGKRARKR